MVMQVTTRAVTLDLADAPPPSKNAHTTYFGIYYNDAKIGFAETAREPLPDGGARFVDRAHWRFKAQGVVQKLSMVTDAVVDANWGLKSFSMRVDAGPARLGAVGVIRGNELDVELTTGNKTTHETIELHGPLLLPGMARAYVAAQPLRAGAAYQIEIYNPVLRSSETLEVVVQGRDEYGWRITEILRGSLRSTVWIDDDGNTVREVSPLGFEMRAQARETALEMPSGDIPDLVFAVMVPVSGRILQPQRTRRLVVRFTGVELDSFPALSDPARQMRDGDVVTVQVKALPESGTYQIPYDGLLGPGSGGGKPPAGWREALASEPLIQSDDERIRQVAFEVIGQQRDPARAAAALHRWVFERVEKKASVGVPSATQVLQDMSGDCNEHTVLYTAMARSVGIPTRMAAGVVYTHARGGGEGMYYHAWPEVWTGEDWIALDPTLGQNPADATHIRFVIGGLDRQVDILGLIGTLRAAVVEVKHEDGPSNPTSQMIE